LKKKKKVLFEKKVLFGNRQAKRKKNENEQKTKKNENGRKMKTRFC